MQLKLIVYAKLGIMLTLHFFSGGNKKNAHFNSALWQHCYAKRLKIDFFILKFYEKKTHESDLEI